MKISKIIALVFAGALFSSYALAETTVETAELTTGGQTSISPVAGADGQCSLLASAVRINLSANVSGFYKCDFANSDIRIGTCHVAGSRAEKTVNCVADADGNYQTSQCSVANDGQSVTFTDRSAFVATSTGGSVGEAALDGNTCTGANVGGLGFFNN